MNQPIIMLQSFSVLIKHIFNSHTVNFSDPLSSDEFQFLETYCLNNIARSDFHSSGSSICRSSNDYIRKNPFDFKLSEVIDDDTEEKTVLTPEQEENLLSFAKTDKTYKKYYDEIVILLETGLRVSELCGLDLNVAVNMKDKLILVEHQLLRDNEVGYYTAPPKTKNGSRQVPMSNRAYEAFKRAIKNRPNGKEFMVDGYSRFLFLNKKGLPKVAVNYDGMLRGLVAKYNKTHDEPLPHITPHTFRHTFCTNMANKGMNPNTLQYIMGHSNITMTLGYYAHGSYASAKSEMDRLCA